MTTGGGKPYLDGVEWVIVADPVTGLASFKVGEAQVSTIVSTKDASALETTGKFNVSTYINYNWCLAPDSANPKSPFANIKVRQAVAYAIDNEAIAKLVSSP